MDFSNSNRPTMTNDAKDAHARINPYAPPEAELLDEDEESADLPEHLAYYRTFFRRLGANCIDGIVLGTYFALLGLTVAELEGLVGWLIGVLSLVLGTAYSVVGHALFGKTIGKKVCRIQVLDLRGRLPGLYRAMLRDAVPVALAGYVVVGGLANQLVVESPYFTSAQLEALPGILGAWHALEFVTMLTNERRRALQDLIAGTVVIRAG